MSECQADANSIKTVELKIPGFGRLIGHEKNGIAEFLNIPFGTIATRFEEATLYEGNEDEAHYDCLHQGPLCPQKEPFNDDYCGIPIDLCAPLDVRYDEFKCLNLRLQVPLACLNINGTDSVSFTEPIPTVVWLHGGSNIAGTPYRGSSNSHRWLERAMTSGKPFSIVTPHYRVGFLGWLPSGNNYNQAISDQRLALEWVHKFGRAWNYDSTKVSLIGQSAGASNAFAHLCDARSYKQVSQIGMLSGLIGSSAFATEDEYRELFMKLRAHLGCDPADATVDRLVEAQSILGINVFSAIKPSGFDFDERWDSLSKVRVVVSDCVKDAYFMNESPEAQSLWSAVKDTAGLPNETLGDFFTRAIFRKGANEIWSKSDHIFRQLCDAVNPFNPALGNMHMVELHYIINGYVTLPEFDAAIKKCQNVWIDLIYLGNPWNPATQAFYLPGRGEPKFLDIGEAWQLRGGKTSEPRVPSELYNALRGY